MNKTLSLHISNTQAALVATLSRHPRRLPQPRPRLPAQEGGGGAGVWGAGVGAQSSEATTKLSIISTRI